MIIDAAEGIADAQAPDRMRVEEREIVRQINARRSFLVMEEVKRIAVAISAPVDLPPRIVDDEGQITGPPPGDVPKIDFSGTGTFRDGKQPSFGGGEVVNIIPLFKLLDDEMS